jgi:ribonuclease D
MRRSLRLKHLRRLSLPGSPPTEEHRLTFQFSFFPSATRFSFVIRDAAKLAALLLRLDAADWVTLDTEADSLHAYPEKLCLLQLSFAGSDELVDPLAGLDLSHLFAHLAKHRLILHGADYDLRLLSRDCAFIPTEVFDTMEAARLLGYRQFGLVHLAADLLGVTLEKGPRTANWAQRPLTERMETYARNDTRYLKPLADILTEQLVSKGRLDWHRQTCARLVEECAKPRVVEPDSVWRLKGSHRLDRSGLAVLRSVWHWRETEAIKSNKPPYFILSHEILVQMASLASHSRHPEKLIPGSFSPRRRASLLTAIARALELSPTERPEILTSRPYRLLPSEVRRFEELKRRRDHRAHELGFEAGLIASRAALELLARDSAKAHRNLLPWQRELLLA